VHLEIAGKSLVIDTGPDFRQQMLSAGINKLDGIIYTHEHKDHTAGLDDIRPFNFMQDKDMPIFGQLKVLNQIKTEFSYIFKKHRYPGIPMVDDQEIQNEPFEAEGIKFTPIEVMHYRLPVFGYRVHDFTYITDANYIAPQEMEKIYGTKILVLNALQNKEHISHFNLSQALEMVDKIQPEKAYLTHVSHKLGLHSEVERKLPANVFLAYDGLKISLDECT
jgi:phosphoribosyl 1,2-cyclic phosphate phosphodiesterase